MTRNTDYVVSERPRYRYVVEGVDALGQRGFVVMTEHTPARARDLAVASGFMIVAYHVYKEVKR